MNRLIIAALLAISVVLAGAPAHADATRIEKAGAGDRLHLKETRLVTEYLLSEYIAPAVTNSPNGGVAARAWGCVVQTRDTGTCHGSVRAGRVTCEGLFKVREYRNVYAAWPVRMTCSTR